MVPEARFFEKTLSRKFQSPKLTGLPNVQLYCPGWRRGLMVSSLLSAEETGAMGREIDSRQVIRVIVKDVHKKYFINARPILGQVTSTHF
jgi:hypothetical protein